MKRFIKQIRKISFLSLFAAQSIVFVILLHEYFNAPLPNIRKSQEVEMKDTPTMVEEEEIIYHKTGKSHRRSVDMFLIDTELKEKSKKQEEKEKVLQNLYLERDYDELVFDPIEKTMKDTYIYQQPKDNLAFMNALFQRADVCEIKWMEEVENFIHILDTQSTYWKTHGDREVIAFAQVQDNLSSSLKTLREETTSLHVDVVKRCYKDYEAYYFAKFNWGNEI